MARGTGALVAFAVAASVAGVGVLQPRLASTLHKLKSNEDLYLFPPPGQLRALTLGYEATTADLLWAKLLIDYGTHCGEKRPFPDLPRYADAILSLEPDFDALFRYIDTLIIYRPPAGTEADARLALKYLQKGTVARPYDPKVWMTLGEFQTYIGPGFLASEADKDEWRKEGAHAIERAVELGGATDRTLSAATILTRAGDTAATIRNLSRHYALTDDPAEREQIALKLQRLQANDIAERSIETVEGEWQKNLPFVSRTMYLLVGPPHDAFACEGEHPEALGCALDWSTRIGQAAPPSAE